MSRSAAAVASSGSICSDILVYPLEVREQDHGLPPLATELGSYRVKLFPEFQE